MPISPEQIVPCRTYVHAGQRPRSVLSIVEGEVIYSIRGVPSFQPRRASVHDFARWAEAELPSLK